MVCWGIPSPMSLTAAELRRHPRATLVDPAAARERSIRRRVCATWYLLYFNTLTYAPGYAVVDLPSKVGKAIAQGSLPLAVLLALTVNPKLKVRPNVFLSIVSLLIFDTVLTAAQSHHPSTMFRTFRLAEFIAVLWLLTPWWGRRDMLLLRATLRCLYVALGSVVLGFCLSPHKAFAYQGRLTGAIWPMLPTQVAQCAAIAAGLTIVLWLGRLMSGRLAAAGVAFSFALLLLTHTRTALVALTAGVLVAGLSIFVINARVRKFFGALVATVTVAIVTVASVITTYLERGQNAAGLTSLTGRTDYWSLVLNLPRTKPQEIFGFGLSNANVNGNPIDSNWLASYMQEGLFGVVVCASVLLFLLVSAFYRAAGVQRALALFLVTYALLASFTEDSFSDVSPYLVYLTVAASLFMTTLSRPAASKTPVARTPRRAMAEDLADFGR
jgi:O-antigen ligase